MKYNKNEVTGKMRDRIILQNVNRSRSLTGFASESWADTATIWAFAESKLPGSNETIIDGKNTAKNVCDFTIRYISTITEESRVVWGDKLYQVKNLKVSHDRRFISFQGVFYDSYILRGVNVDASVNGIGTTLANLKLIMSVIGQANASASTTATITKIIEVSSLVNANASLSGDINFVQKAQASLLATGTTTADLTVNAPSASLLLDLYPSAAAAYSLRKLRTAYSGSAVRVRRSSDNTEQDIGFVAGQLDTASLLAFCGAGNGFVTSWYDQSGDARDAAQTTQANQPQIVSSGSLILENGKVSISYDGTNDTLISSNYNFGTTSYSSFVVSRSGGLNSSGRAIYTIKTINPSENGYFHLVFRNNISNNFRSYYSSDGASLNFLIQTPLNVFPTTQNLISNIVPTSGNITFNLNSIQQDSDLAIGQTLNNTIFLIGNYYAGLIESENFFHQGTISELIIYMSNEQSNRTGVETNINTHYEIY
jgi:SPP1 family predicted phage head-tail adaptor